MNDVCKPEYRAILEREKEELESLTVDELIAKIENYPFECVGGDLRNCQDWHDLKDKIARCSASLTNAIPDIRGGWSECVENTLLAVARDLKHGCK